ncbi:hypothetical protein NQ317_012425 [Molorchus minor]|uniref:Uncharacterized protein n=1 Tax=Molorchus minor TaxID=1323400 RepID=A0ABQ9JB03_9CUCU|nr:hypothetical protein NQ317_012425 [Molorchus minor]
MINLLFFINVCQGHNVDRESRANKFFFPNGFKDKFTEHGLKYEKETLEAFKERNYSHVITPSLVIAKSLPCVVSKEGTEYPAAAAACMCVVIILSKKDSRPVQMVPQVQNGRSTTRPEKIHSFI